MVNQYNLQIYVIFLVIILFICYLIMNNSNISTTKSIQYFSMNTPNQPLQEGIYEYDIKSASSPTYPNGKHETGIRTITNEGFGQRSISKGIVSYTNNNGQLVIKDDYYEQIYLKDSLGKKIMFLIGSVGTNGMYNFVSENNGDFIYESVYRQSELTNDSRKVINKYYKIKDDYKIDNIHYNKSTKNFELYRWGTLKKINTLYKT